MSHAIRRRLPICNSCYRAFATTTASRLPLEKRELGPVPTEIPPYPYGPAQWYKQSDSGLYGGQRIRFGNNVGPKSGTKSRRSWAINVFRKRLFSKALNTSIQLRVSKTVLRTIDKLGGLDNYLLGEKEGRIKGLGMKGWQLRWAIMQTPSVKNKFRAERKALGLEDQDHDVERVESEKRAAMELQEMIANEAPVELDVDEMAERDPESFGGGVAEDQLSEDEEASWEDVGDLSQAQPGENFHLHPRPMKYPRIRLGSGRHMTLTPNGWRVRIPTAQRTNEPDKEKMIKREESSHRRAAKAVLRAHNTALQEQGQPPLSPEEKRAVLRKARSRFRGALNRSKELDETYQQRLKDFRQTETKKAIAASSQATKVAKTAKQRKRRADAKAKKRSRLALS